LQIRLSLLPLIAFAILCGVLAPLSSNASSMSPETLLLAKGWQLQDAAKVPQSGDEVASPTFDTKGWYTATVPGTVLTTLVNNHVYPEPLYGENNRPEVIPESLARTSYWYRTLIDVPKSYKNHHVWLNFDGINYSASVWVNSVQVGAIRGAFIRGIFDITTNVKPGKTAVLAVLVTPQPTPGVPHEHTLRDGLGKNGGVTALDGPTFLSTIGWDWIPAIRDRDTGIWQRVFLSSQPIYPYPALIRPTSSCRQPSRTSPTCREKALFKGILKTSGSRNRWTSHRIASRP